MEVFNEGDITEFKYLRKLYGNVDFLQTAMQLMCKKFQSDITLGTDGVCISFYIVKIGLLIKFEPEDLDEFSAPDELVENLYDLHGAEIEKETLPWLKKYNNQ